MIKNINAKDFRGLEFDQALGPKMLFVGPNGTGKSARSDAIILLLTGSLPGKARTDLILETYGSGDKLTIGGKFNGKLFHRQLARDKKGTVSQKFLIDRHKAKKEDFIKAMVESGAPKVVDLSAFITLSNQKKIDYIFELFPPTEDLGKLDDEIQELNEKMNAKYAEIRDGEKLIASLTETKADMKLPQGTLAEVQAAITRTQNAYRETLDRIKKAEITEAEIKAKEKAEAEAKAKEEKNQNELKKPAPTPETKSAGAGSKPDIPPPIDTMRDASPVEKSDYQSNVEFHQEVSRPLEPQSGNGSLQKVISVMEKVGCKSCAAYMIAKREMKNLGISNQ